MDARPRLHPERHEARAAVRDDAADPQGDRARNAVRDETSRYRFAAMDVRQRDEALIYRRLGTVVARGRSCERRRAANDCDGVPLPAEHRLPHVRLGVSRRIEKREQEKSCDGCALAGVELHTAFR